MGNMNPSIGPSAGNPIMGGGGLEDTTISVTTTPTLSNRFSVISFNVEMTVET
jgi:hypothetical protein